MPIKKISAATFKTHCLAIMDEVHAKRQPVLITKHGKPIAKLVPADESKTTSSTSWLAGGGLWEKSFLQP